MPGLNIWEFLGIEGTGLAAAAAVLALFWKADDAVSDEFREGLSKKLQRIKVDTSDVDWAQSFKLIFDRVFGKEHVTWKCFWRSSLASLASVFFLLALNLSIFQGEPKITDFPLWLTFFIVFISFNLIPDYISLLETRWIIEKIVRRQSTYEIALLMIADIIATALIFVVLGNFILVFYGTPLGGALVDVQITTATELTFIEHFSAKAELLLKGMSMIVGKLTARETLLLKDFPTVGVFFYSTLFTSVWVWLSVTSWFVIRNGARFQSIVAAAQFILPIKTKPMRAIGEVSALVVALIFLTSGLLGIVV